jgi:diguanylate cyclase (GGDEF)-like protein/PAS domain S-box-containing protein
MTGKYLPTLLPMALLASIYYAAGYVGLALAVVNPNASGVWPATGIALAALLLFGYRLWPGVFLGALAVNLTASGVVGASLMIALGNTLEAVFGAYLVNVYANGRDAFGSSRTIFRFVVLAAMLSTAVSATLGTATLALSGLARWSEFSAVWSTWWLGDATGALIVTPLILLWANAGLRWERSRTYEAALLLLAVVAVGVGTFSGWAPERLRGYPLVFAIFPIIVWAAFRFGRRIAATTTVLLAAMAIWGTLRELGPFAIFDENESLLLLQGFMAVVSITGLTLAAMVAERRQNERALRASEEQYRIVTDTATDVVVTIDRHSRITYINAAAEKIFGYRPAELIGRSLTELMPTRLRALHRGSFERYQRTGQRHIGWTNVELPGLHKDGHEIPLEISFSEFKRDDKHLFTGIVRDVSERKRAEESQRWLATIVESSTDAIIGATLDGNILSWNQAAEHMYGYSAEEMIGRPIALLAPPERAEEGARLIERVRQGERIENFETRRRRKDGKQLYVSLTISPIRDAIGTIRGVSTIARDISERKRTEARIRYLAHHDALTGLPNRLLFRDRIGHAIAQARRAHKQAAVLFLDLDGFKHINDSLGHEIGDKLLRMTARRLEGCLRHGDSVARLGGDEFVISLSDLTDNRDAMPIAEKVLQALREPFHVQQHELHVSGSIGISLYPSDGEDADVLMRAADAAMYHAKENGRNNYQFFTARLNEASRRRLQIANYMHQALEQHEFKLYYQPQVDMQSGRIVAAEALIRWWQPQLGFVATGEFIKVAEETGLIVPIGDWVLHEGCADLRHWYDAGFTQLRLTVNLSPQQFRRPGFVETTARVLEENHLPASALGLEITESVLMMQSEENLAILRRLAEMGIHIAVDDFGVGYSSLSYLQRFPFHTLKIDRSFVNGIGHDSNDAALVMAVIAMTRNLHLEVVGEGVENADQAAFLREHGCTVAQGYHFGEAIAAESFEQLLRAAPAPGGARVSQFRGY